MSAHLRQAWASLHRTSSRYIFEVPYALSKDDMMTGAYEGGWSVVEVEADSEQEAKLMALQIVYSRHQPSGGPYPASDETLLKLIRRRQESRTAAKPRLRMWRSNEQSMTYCTRCMKRNREEWGTDDPEDVAFLDSFRPIYADDPSIGPGSIEVCSQCGRNIVNSLDKDDR